jgi:phosphohistidine phosphatase SixA
MRALLFASERVGSRLLIRAVGLFVLLLPPLVSPAADWAGLPGALRHGGYVLVMRHASSPREIPERAAADPDNTTPERQLDEAGRRSAAAMGQALRQLRIPITTVLSSPTYRARQTIRLAGLVLTRTVPELGEGGASMQGAGAGQAEWLRQQAALPPVAGNTLLVTHFPTISAAFPQWARTVEDGETLVLLPDGKGGTSLVARIKIEEWPGLVP